MRRNTGGSILRNVGGVSRRTTGGSTLRSVGSVSRLTTGGWEMRCVGGGIGGGSIEGVDVIGSMGGWPRKRNTNTAATPAVGNNAAHIVREREADRGCCCGMARSRCCRSAEGRGTPKAGSCIASLKKSENSASFDAFTSSILSCFFTTIIFPTQGFFVKLSISTGASCLITITFCGDRNDPTAHS